MRIVKTKTKKWTRPVLHLLLRHHVAGSGAGVESSSESRLRLSSLSIMDNRLRNSSAESDENSGAKRWVNNRTGMASRLTEKDRPFRILLCRLWLAVPSKEAVGSGFP